MKTAQENPSITTAEVIGNPDVAPGHFLLTLRLSSSFVTPRPGQFVMIRDAKRGEPLLPRPLSVYGFHREGGQAVLELLYRAAGRGTSLFSEMKPGSSLNILGPLGRGFTIQRDVPKVILLAGGVGIAPLTYLLQEGFLRKAPLQQPGITAYFGAKTAELLTGLDRLKGFCDLRTATDDGSAGYHGLVTDLLRGDLGGYEPEKTMIYACGPVAMIRSLSHVVGKSVIRCEVSLEERMACGIGACLGCAVAITESHGKTAYRRVCHDGPVFDIREIALHPGRDEQDTTYGIG